MLNELIMEAIWLAAPILLVGLFAWAKRLRWIWLSLLVLSGLLIGIQRQLFTFSEVFQLPVWLDLADVSLLVLAWIGFGQAMRACGGIRSIGSPIVTAGISGALMGDLACAFFLPTLVLSSSLGNARDDSYRNNATGIYPRHSN